MPYKEFLILIPFISNTDKRSDSIYIKIGRITLIDLLKSINGLTAIVQESFKLDPIMRFYLGDTGSDQVFAVLIVINLKIR